MKCFYGKRFFCIWGAIALVTVLFSTGAAGVDVTPVWTNNYQGSDGSNAVVAVQGSKTFVAYCNASGVPPETMGKVEMYDAHGNYVGGSDLDLNGGKVTAIAVSGSRVYVAGYTGTAGGTENVFVVAFKASNKGLTILWEQAPGPTPNAGLYPIGIKALGSKIVLFYNNTSDSGVIQGTVMALNQKDGTKKWDAPFQGGSPSGKVNAITIQGSTVFRRRDHQGYRWE